MDFTKRILSTSFLEYAFLKYVLEPATHPSITSVIHPQYKVEADNHTYYVDYVLAGQRLQVAIELDGYAFHSDRSAFSYDRLRQNDLQAEGLTILRFSYDNVRTQTARCIEQLQVVMHQDPLLHQYIKVDYIVPVPQMDPSPLYALQLTPRHKPPFAEQRTDFFVEARRRLNVDVLRTAQREALYALTNYFIGFNKEKQAACVMAVGSGKTVLGIAATIAFTQRRAMIVTPGNVIRDTFEQALDAQAIGNAFYHLPSGPLLPGCRAPRVVILDREDVAISSISREHLLSAEIIVANYHSLGDGSAPGDLLAKLQPDDIDFLIIDEAHIAASTSYQRLFRHFFRAQAILMSACFRRLDGKPIEAEVVYRYRLIDAITDGVAKSLMVHRHIADPNQIVYEVVYPDGSRSEITGKDNLLEIVQDERKLSVITAKSLEPIRRVMKIVRKQLDIQTNLLFPVKPRVLFSALGEQHAAQIAQVAREFGIPCAHLHHKMGQTRLRRLRERFERDSGDLQGLVHLRMLGQGYDFKPITIVVPMRPYGSFGEFYQFIGRGIRILTHPELDTASKQRLDVIFHSELDLERHLEDLRNENDIDPLIYETFSDEDILLDEVVLEDSNQDREEISSRPDVFVLTTPGKAESGVLHTPQQIERRQQEREREASAADYARYVESSPTPISFEEYLEIVRQMRDE